MDTQVTVNRRDRRSALNMPRMHNNRKIGRSRKVQLIYNEPQKLLLERYITDHMLEKAIHLGYSKKKALELYGKNRYRNNPDAKVAKIIVHSN